MITSIALKEFYSNLISSRFLLGFLLCLFLIPFAMVVSIHDHAGQQRAYEMDRKQAEEENQPTVYSGLRPRIVRPPEPLSIVNSGVSGQVGNTVKILIGEKPMLAGGRGMTRENPLMNAFFSLFKEKDATDKDSPHWYNPFEDYSTTRKPIKFQEAPLYQERVIPLTARVAGAGKYFLIMGLYAAAIYALTFVLFARYGVR